MKPLRCDCCMRATPERFLEEQASGLFACNLCLDEFARNEEQWRQETASPFVGCVAFVGTALLIITLIAVALFC